MYELCICNLLMSSLILQRKDGCGDCLPCYSSCLWVAGIHLFWYTLGYYMQDHKTAANLCLELNYYSLSFLLVWFCCFRHMGLSVYKVLWGLHKSLHWVMSSLYHHWLVVFDAAAYTTKSLLHSHLSYYISELYSFMCVRIQQCEVIVIMSLRYN